MIYKRVYTTPFAAYTSDEQNTIRSVFAWSRAIAMEAFEKLKRASIPGDLLFLTRAPAGWCRIHEDMTPSCQHKTAKLVDGHAASTGKPAWFEAAIQALLLRKRRRGDVRNKNFVSCLSPS